MYIEFNCLVYGYVRLAEGLARAADDISEAVADAFAALAAQETSDSANEAVLSCTSSAKTKNASENALTPLTGVVVALLLDVIDGGLSAQVCGHGVRANGLHVDSRGHD